MKPEQPQRRIYVAEYQISKYPITNLEYQSFLKDTGYEPPKDWNGYSYPYEKGNHPVVNIRSKDANNYCIWLSKKTDDFYRLPTDAEWEKAARGKDGRIYPWGNDFEKNRANTEESNISETTPVGIFSPQGDSPYGCADMAGNVWEWCIWQTEVDYSKQQRIKPDNREEPERLNARILRGGSFHYDFRAARCAFRLQSTPNDWLNDCGFRVVCSSTGKV